MMTERRCDRCKGVIEMPHENGAPTTPDLSVSLKGETRTANDLCARCAEDVRGFVDRIFTRSKRGRPTGVGKGKRGRPKGSKNKGPKRLRKAARPSTPETPETVPAPVAEAAPAPTA